MEAVKGDVRSANIASSNIIVDGQTVHVQGYNIENSTYFKLRDIAYAINGTEKQFDTLWNEKERAINVLTNTPYSVAGGEMQKGANKNKTALLSDGKLYFDNIEKALTAYNIDGNTYFKLRDLAKALDIGIAWNESSQTIAIETNSSYTE